MDLDHDAVSCIIPGASSISQVLSNCSVSGLESLNSNVHESLRAFYMDKIHKHIRGNY